MVTFVNPYTFVPHVKNPARSEPAGHCAMVAGNVSGSFAVRIEARTPLLIGGGPKESDPPGRERQLLLRRADGTVMIPGSSLLGAARSLHEALTGSCLRVLDTDWQAVHRHPASTAETGNLKLAMVLQVDNKGRPKSVAIADDAVWINKNLLPSQPPHARTGDRIRFPGAPVDENGRQILRHGGLTVGRGLTATLDNSYVLLVTDTAARAADKPCYFVAGRMAPGVPSYPVSEDARELFKRCVDGTNDMRVARQGGNVPESPPAVLECADVVWPPDGHRVIGERLRARRYLRVGQPVWVRVANGEVSEMRLSQLWRYRGAHAVSERVDDAGPCTDPEQLCWSCRVFGSADPTERNDSERAVQNSYGGHVRIDDCLAVGSVEGVAEDLAPLLSPHPSAGQFYLDNEKAKNTVADKDDRPAAHWGSCADDRATRPIRGRKFYWRTNAPELSGRGRRRGHHSDEVVSRVTLIPAGTAFTGRVSFDNLSPADLGSLLACLDPARIWHEEDPAGFASSLGGGKPFGLGSVSVHVEGLRLSTAASRYLDEPMDVECDEDSAHDAFIDEIQGRGIDWAALEHVLRFGYIGDDLVWYPPSGNGQRGQQAYDESFEWFSASRGVQLRDRTVPLKTLPAARGSAKSQPLNAPPRP